jgi:sarcosine oxidase
LETTRHFDVIVLGLGGMGSATCAQLAMRKQRVLGIEQFGIAHDRGSSHGITRIIRLAYHKNPDYVPLVRRSIELWRDLEAQAQQSFLIQNGSVDAGEHDSVVFSGSLKSCQLHQLDHQVLTSAELSLRYPGYQLPKEHMAVFQPDGGFLLPERCIEAYVAAAKAHGAELRFDCPVSAWEPTKNGVEVRVADAVYSAERLVITAGAWMGKLMPELAPVLQPERQVLIWTETRQSTWFKPTHFPVFTLSVPEGRFYGLPEYGVPGFKIGKLHHLSEPVDPDRASQDTNTLDERVLRTPIERYFPFAAGRTLTMRTCMFTNTPDEDFIIGSLPSCPAVVIAGGGSGHAFKFCSVIGEIVCDLVIDGTTRHSIEMFRPNRFAPAQVS